MVAATSCGGAQEPDPQAFIESVRKPGAFSNTPSYPQYTDGELIDSGRQACDLIRPGVAGLDPDAARGRTQVVSNVSLLPRDTFEYGLAWQEITFAHPCICVPRSASARPPTLGGRRPPPEEALPDPLREPTPVLAFEDHNQNRRSWQPEADLTPTHATSGAGEMR